MKNQKKQPNASKELVQENITQVGRDVSFFFRHRRRIIRISVFVLIVAILLFILYRIWLHVFFLITDDLIVEVSPSDFSTQLVYSEQNGVDISIEVKNSLFCGASCSYSFTDLSTGALIEQGILEGPSKSFEKQFSVSGSHKGTGQRLYSFVASCHNTRTWHCLSDQKIRERSSFIVVDYGLSDEEKELWLSLRKNIEELAAPLEAIGNGLSYIQQRIDSLTLDVKDSSNQLSNLKQRYEKSAFSVYEAADYLSENDFEQARLSIISAGNASVLEKEVQTLNDSISARINRKNSLIRSYNHLNAVLANFSAVADESLKSQIAHQISKVYSLRSLMESDERNAILLADQIAYDVKKIQRSLNLSLQNASSYGIFYSALETKRLCLAFGNCAGFSYSKNDDPLHQVTEQCNYLKGISGNFNETGSEASRNITEFAKQQVYTDLLSKKDPLLEVLNISFDVINEPDLLEGNETLSMLEDTRSFLGVYCNGSRQKPKELPIIEEPAITGKKVILNVSVAEQLPRCCVFGECDVCCDGCQKNASLYPILFLHGHTFNSDNSPDYSLDAFSTLQQALAEKGYVSAGTITPISNYVDVRSGDWGRIRKPIMVKGSFYRLGIYDLGSYFIATQKSENLETYAIRLKEMIELLKFRTGKDKVIIVSHSMGGLVARSYLQIFGDNSVEKLIMVGVPNQGIRDPVTDYCSFLGEKKECTDMAQASIFLKNLNGPRPSSRTQIYSIIGTGCPMEQGTGDGIVLEQDAHLENTTEFFINGTCVGFSDVLHTQMLDVGKYPKVKDIIIDILKD